MNVTSKYSAGGLRRYDTERRRKRNNQTQTKQNKRRLAWEKTGESKMRELESWRDHEEDEGESSPLMVNKTVSKAEHTVLNTSISFSSLYDLLWFPLSVFSLLSSSHQYSFQLPLTHFFCFFCFLPYLNLTLLLFFYSSDRKGEREKKLCATMRECEWEEIEWEKWEIEILSTVCSGPLMSLLNNMNISQVFISLFSCGQRFSSQ